MVLDLIALAPSSRVWVYQADRFLSYDELDDARELLFPFLEQWTSHTKELYTYGNIFHRRFLALFVDESASHGTSGCSIDSSVHFIQQLGAKLNIDFFDRMHFCYLDDQEEVQSVNRVQLKEKYAAGDIKEDTFFFDNLVDTKENFIKNWTVQLGESWIKKML